MILWSGLPGRFANLGARFGAEKVDVVGVPRSCRRARRDSRKTWAPLLSFSLGHDDQMGHHLRINLNKRMKVVVVTGIGVVEELIFRYFRCCCCQFRNLDDDWLSLLRHLESRCTEGAEKIIDFFLPTGWGLNNLFLAFDTRCIIVSKLNQKIN